MNASALTRTFLSAAALCLALGAVHAAPAPAGGAPPLLDREFFFGDPEISGAQLSPDGRFVAFVKPLDGTRNVWVKKIDEPFDKARPLTDDTKRPVTGYFWTQDGKFILFVQDQGGDENYNIYAVDPAAPAAEGRKVPAARNLTDAKGARALIYSVPKSDPDVMYVGLNDRDKAWHDLYRVKISTGERTLLRKNEDRIAAWVFDNAGTLRLAARTTDAGDTEILRVDKDGLKTIYTCGVFETCGPVRFTKDNARVYMMTNKGDADLIRLTVLDPATSKEEAVESDPKKRVDLARPVFSEKTDELIGTAYEDERVRVYWRDKSYEKIYKFLQSKFPGKDVDASSSTRDERLWLIAVSSDTEPGERYLFERDTQKLTFQYRVFEKLPREHLATMKPITYKSSDGLEIPAFLTLPKGVAPKNLPLIVFPHGGPWARDSWGYDAFAQFLANRGYAVLQPNFRASTGYGKKFLNAGNNEWGQKMQDDLTWGVKHLVAGGIVDAKRVGIMGGSYGGYATLAGVAFTPDVYAAGVSIVGPSNLITLLESIPPYWESIRTIFHTRMGNPNTPEGRKQLERQSPLFSAKAIKTPLLVVQGANDPRVNKAESDQIVIALRDRGFPVEYLVAPDEGHGFARPVNNMAMIAVTEKFLAKHLGGRFQEGATPEVAQRLTEITVDPKTVTMPKKVDARAAALPKPASDLAPGTAKYTSTIALGGQSMKLESVREIAEENGRWIVTETVKTPMGDAVDRVVLEKGSLKPQSRTVTQGPGTIEVTFTDAKASGSMAMGGAPNPFSVDLEGPIFADGAGMGDVIAHLPLADGYTALFRNLDLQRQKVKVMQLKVVGRESVTVAAGTFDAQKVELVSTANESEKATLWVANDPPRLVKLTAVSPEMGGATVTAELTP